MQKLVISLLGLGAVLVLGSCATPEKKPVGPQSDQNYMPWNTPRPGEGTAAFGGLLNEGR